MEIIMYKCMDCGEDKIPQRELKDGYMCPKCEGGVSEIPQSELEKVGLDSTVSIKATMKEERHEKMDLVKELDKKLNDGEEHARTVPLEPEKDDDLLPFDKPAVKDTTIKEIAEDFGVKEELIKEHTTVTTKETTEDPVIPITVKKDVPIPELNTVHKTASPAYERRDIDIILGDIKTELQSHPEFPANSLSQYEIVRVAIEIYKIRNVK